MDDDKEFKKESKEHPSFSPKLIRRIVEDHKKEKKSIPSIWDLRRSL